MDTYLNNYITLMLVKYVNGVSKRSSITDIQLVEQWTENPCVPGSIPGGTTKKTFV